MDEYRKHSATSNIVRFVLRHSITGDGLTGLSNASSGLIIATITDNEAATTTYTVGSSNVETITTLATYAAPTASKCRFKEVDATNHKGLYEFQFADARFSVSSARSLRITVTGATNLLTAHWRIALVQFDPFDTVRLGLTALPNAAAEASGGLPTLSAAQASNGTIQANVHRWLTGTPNALQSGRVDSYLGAVASGVIAAASFAANALDAVWSTTTRILTAATNITSTGGTTVPQTGDSYARIGAPVGASVSADIAGVQSDTDNIQTRLPAALVSGRMDSNMQAAANGVITAAVIATDAIDADALATDAITEIQSGLSTLTAAGVRTAVGLASANLDTQLDALPTNTELATALAAADDAVLAAIAALNNLSQANIRTAVGLASANLDTQLDALPTNAELATALGTADDAVLAAIAALNNLSASQVNAEVVDALATDTYAEPGQGAPAATTTLAAKINYLYKSWRNKKDGNGMVEQLYADNGTTVDQKATVAESAGVVTKSEVVSGP